MKKFLSKMLLVLLCNIFLIGCGGSDSQKKSDKKANNETMESSTEAVKQDGISFGELESVGNNIANLVNHQVSHHRSAIAFDDKYIYYLSENFDGEEGLWRIKQNGSDSENYIPDFFGTCFNIIDGVLYYKGSDSGGVFIGSVNLANKEMKKLCNTGSIDELLVVNNKLYWTEYEKERVSVFTMSTQGTTQKKAIYSGYYDVVTGKGVLTTDGKRIYFLSAVNRDEFQVLVTDATTTEDASHMEVLSKSTISGSPSIAHHGYKYICGANGFMATKYNVNSGITTYDTLLFDEIKDNFKNSAWKEQFTLDQTGEMAWLDANRAKYGIGNSIIAVDEFTADPFKYNPEDKEKEGLMTVYFIQDMDIENSNVIYEYHDDNFLSAGVNKDIFYLILKTDSGINFVTVDKEGVVTEIK